MARSWLEECAADDGWRIVKRPPWLSGKAGERGWQVRAALASVGSALASVGARGKPWAPEGRANRKNDRATDGALIRPWGADGGIGGRGRGIAALGMLDVNLTLHPGARRHTASEYILGHLGISAAE